MYDQLKRGYGVDNLVYANMCLWHFLTAFAYTNKHQFSIDEKRCDLPDIAIDFLSKKITEVIMLKEIEVAVNLSPTHFSALFKKKTGFSLLYYFNRLKVQKACQYLLFATMRIQEIALELGISDQYYFREC